MSPDDRQRCGYAPTGPRLARDLQPAAWYGDRLTFDFLALLLPLCALGFILAAMTGV